MGYDDDDDGNGCWVMTTMTKNNDSATMTTTMTTMMKTMAFARRATGYNNDCDVDDSGRRRQQGHGDGAMGDEVGDDGDGTMGIEVDNDGYGATDKKVDDNGSVRQDITTMTMVTGDRGRRQQ